MHNLNQRQLVIALIFLGLLGWGIRTGFRYEASRTGDVVEITQGWTNTQIQLQGAPSRAAYLIVGEGLRGKKHYIGSLPVIPLGTVQELNQKFGDFRKCSSPGAAESMSRVVHLRFVTANEACRRKISDLIARSKSFASDKLVVVDEQPFVIQHQSDHSRRNRAEERLSAKEVYTEEIALEDYLGK